MSLRSIIALAKMEKQSISTRILKIKGGITVAFVRKSQKPEEFPDADQLYSKVSEDRSKKIYQIRRKVVILVFRLKDKISQAIWEAVNVFSFQTAPIELMSGEDFALIAEKYPIYTTTKAILNQDELFDVEPMLHDKVTTLIAINVVLNFLIHEKGFKISYPNQDNTSEPLLIIVSWDLRDEEKITKKE